MGTDFFKMTKPNPSNSMYCMYPYPAPVWVRKRVENKVLRKFGSTEKAQCQQLSVF